MLKEENVSMNLHEARQLLRYLNGRSSKRNRKVQSKLVKYIPYDFQTKKAWT